MRAFIILVTPLCVVALGAELAQADDVRIEMKVNKAQALQKPYTIRIEGNIDTSRGLNLGVSNLRTMMRVSHVKIEEGANGPYIEIAIQQGCNIDHFEFSTRGVPQFTIVAGEELVDINIGAQTYILGLLWWQFLLAYALLGLITLFMGYMLLRIRWRSASNRANDADFLSFIDDSVFPIPSPTKKLAVLFVVLWLLMWPVFLVFLLLHRFLRPRSRSSNNGAT